MNLPTCPGSGRYPELGGRCSVCLRVIKVGPASGLIRWHQTEKAPRLSSRRPHKWTRNMNVNALYFRLSGGLVRRDG